jgi:hypothetical protein
LPNHYFDNFNYQPEQDLVEDLIIESIGIYGIECYYIPRVLRKFDQLYGEDPISTYEKAYLIDMYIRNVEGFSGQGDFLSKFYSQIRDSITFTVAKRTFNELIGTPENFTRAREGDLVWFPLNKKLFIIKFVEHEAIFYQFGSLQTYDLKCDLFEYSNEKFNTGVPEIDIFQQEFSFAMTDDAIETQDNSILTTQDGQPLVSNDFDFGKQTGETFEDNDTITTQASDIIDFSESNPFSE